MFLFGPDLFQWQFSTHQMECLSLRIFFHCEESAKEQTSKQVQGLELQPGVKPCLSLSGVKEGAKQILSQKLA